MLAALCPGPSLFWAAKSVFFSFSTKVSVDTLDTLDQIILCCAGLFCMLWGV